MEKFKQIFNALTLMVLLSVAASCSKFETPETDDESRVVYKAEMVFEGELTTFDADTRSSASSWEDGATIYLQFYTGSYYVDGLAVYDSETSKWNLEFYGEITSNKERVCSAVYVENAVAYGYHDVTVDENSIIYEDTEGSYYYENNILTVSAHLVPKTGRIRFEGEPGYQYTFTGLSHYTRYNIANNVWTYETESYSARLPESGKSDYYYVFFSEDNASREIQFYDKENNARYEKVFPEGVLANGISGYMNIPTVKNHNSWASDPLVKTFTVGDVSFNMVLVDGGTITCGPREYNTVAYWTPFKITVDHDYYISETEVTEALYSAVTGEDITKGASKDTPKNHYLDYNSSTLDVFDYLKEKTGFEFCPPYLEEWRYAACGGLLTHRYSFSGSNNIDEVAWYDCEEPQEVKQKMPNELGIYDMSGNFAELTRKLTSYGYWRYEEYVGGSYDTGRSECQLNESTTYGTDGYGIRLYISAAALRN